MALKVIGAGLGRTGTLSLKFALEYLGYEPCHHMAEVFANASRQVPLWLGAIGGQPDWDAVFEGFEAAVDYPGCYHWRALAAHYPEAKIILSLRDADKWFDSVSTTIFSEHMTGMMLNSPLKPFFEGAVVRDFGMRIGERAFMTDYFRRWNEAVIAEVPSERLLVFEARDGWAPLCAFLGVPVPDVAYPRVNSREEMMERMSAGGRAQGQAPPPDPEMMMAMAKSHLEHQRQTAFGAAA